MSVFRTRVMVRGWRLSGSLTSSWSATSRDYGNGPRCQSAIRLQRARDLDECCRFVRGAHQALPVEAENHDDDPVDAELRVALDAVAVGSLEVRADADLDLGARAALLVERPVESVEGLRHLVGLAVEAEPPLPQSRRPPQRA